MRCDNLTPHYVSQVRETHTGCLCETADYPLVEFGWRIDGGRSCIFDKWLADNVDRKPESILCISVCIFDTGSGST